MLLSLESRALKSSGRRVIAACSVCLMLSCFLLPSRDSHSDGEVAAGVEVKRRSMSV